DYLVGGQAFKHLPGKHNQQLHDPYKGTSTLSISNEYSPPPLDDKLIDEIDTVHGPWDAAGLSEELDSDSRFYGIEGQFRSFMRHNSQWTQGADPATKAAIEYTLKNNPTVRTLSLYDSYSSEHGRPGQDEWPTFREWLDTEGTFYRFGPTYPGGMTSFAKSLEGARDAANALPDEKPLVLKAANKNLLGFGMTGIGEVYVEGEAISD
ncbi:MAG: hypothetical protein ACXABY_30320, partial [Candidatus Thorarchaeota archaeon]